MVVAQVESLERLEAREQGASVFQVPAERVVGETPAKSASVCKERDLYVSSYGS